MARITGSYPDDLNLLIEGAVEAGVFGGKSDALREFVREVQQPYGRPVGVGGEISNWLPHVVSTIYVLIVTFPSLSMPIVVAESSFGKV